MPPSPRDSGRSAALTLQGAVRYDHAASWFPEQTLGPSKYFPNQDRLPGHQGRGRLQRLHAQRMGMAYDVFGNGKTAFKVNLGKYLEGVGVSTNYANSNPTLRIPTSTGPFGVQGVNRAWTDADSDFVPDCDLNNLAAQDLRATGGDFCGAVSNTRWGQNVLTNNYDPDLLKGWGVRPSDWDFGASVQQQILTRMSVEVAFHRRSFARLHGAGQHAGGRRPSTASSASPRRRIPSCPTAAATSCRASTTSIPAKFGQILNNVTDSSTFGDTSQVFNGVDFTVNLRQGGLTLQGGTSTGQTTSEFCDVRRNLPELNLADRRRPADLDDQRRRARTATSSSGFLTQFRGLASYVIPKIDAQISAVFQSKPGPAIVANYAGADRRSPARRWDGRSPATRRTSR